MLLQLMKILVETHSLPLEEIPKCCIIWEFFSSIVANRIVSHCDSSRQKDTTWQFLYFLEKLRF